MWVAPAFPGDDDGALMWAQHDLWFRIGGAWIEDGDYAMTSCAYLFSCARKAVMFYTVANPLFFPERDRLPSVDRFDHRVLQDAHDVIAAYYRWCNMHAKRPAFANNDGALRATPLKVIQSLR